MQAPDTVLRGKQRWESESTFRDEWKARTDTLIGWIPDGSNVLEFGAGSLVAKDSLCERGCTYRNSDWVERDDETLVLDLNLRPLPNPTVIGTTDYVILAGVFEYISGLEELFEWLSTLTKRMVFSFMPLEGNLSQSEDYQAKLNGRVKKGVVNHHTPHEFVMLASRYFSLVETSLWGNQLLFHAVSNKAIAKGE